MCGRYKLTASERELMKKCGMLGPAVFPGEWITSVNKHRRFEDVWWTIRDGASDGKISPLFTREVFR